MTEGLEEFLSYTLQAVEKDMRSFMEPFDLPLYDMLRYHLGWKDERGEWLPVEESKRYGGKRIRPLLLLALVKALGGDVERAIPAATAVELLHNFSLIHDDVEDKDIKRRFRPTVWKVWGIPQAVNAGSSMQGLVNLSALRLREHFPPHIVTNILESLSLIIKEMTEGQYLDLALQEATEGTVSDYLDMARKKTGALFDYTCRIAGVLAGREEEVEKLGKCGRFFGLAFQVKDDYLGIWGISEEIGKPAEDIHKGKITFPVVFALNKSERKEELREILRKKRKTKKDIDKALEILEEVGAKGYTMEICESYRDDAIFYLSRVEGDKGFLRQLEEFFGRVLKIGDDG